MAVVEKWEEGAELPAETGVGMGGEGTRPEGGETVGGWL